MLRNDTVEVGTELPRISRRPTTRDLVRYAQGANDSAPLHYDKDYAQERGFDSVIVHGALKAAYMAQVLTEWVGDDGWVTEFRAEYRKPDVPSKLLTAGGKVEALWDDPDGLRVNVALWVENEEGQVTTRGTGTVVLQSRNGEGDASP